MGLTRRELIRAGAGSALAGAGLYGLVDALAGPVMRAGAAVVPHLPEQHVLQGLRIVTSDGVAVFAPPLHSEVVTARLRVGESRSALAEAREELERRLASLDERYSSTPSGLAVTVAWGLPYFRRYVPGQARHGLPTDLRASAALGRTVRALTDAQRFPSDREHTRLEENDVAVLLRSDSRARVDEAAAQIFAPGLFEVTSRRQGFAGGGFAGRSLPKRMALAAGIPGAERIPDTAELFLGFTSTQKQRPGRERINNLETLGYTDVREDGYFAHGTHMHLSHLYEDLEAWYSRLSDAERVGSMFRPGLEVASGTLSLRQGPAQAETGEMVARGFHRHGRIGHSGSIQPSSRLAAAVTGPDGVVYERGTPIPHRADFNTLDNPFSFSADPAGDRARPGPAAGLHFVVFNPTSDDFSRNRLAMDGRLPHDLELPLAPRSSRQGINAVLEATHRQNFLVPPRVRRSFPLLELPA